MTQPTLHSPKQLAKKGKKNPEGEGILPFCYEVVLRKIKSGQIKFTNYGCEKKAIYLISSLELAEYLKSVKTI